MQFTASAELRDKLQRLQALTREDLAEVIEAAVSEKLERLESKRFGLTKSPRKPLDQTNTSPSSRYLPSPVRRIVRRRDGNQCTFINRNGIRCAERRGLEFHHRKPYGRGGAHSPDNVCVMCRQHNAYLAERDYGKEHMQKFRRRPDRVSEGLPDYVVGLAANHACWSAPPLNRSVDLGRACRRRRTSRVRFLKSSHAPGDTHDSR